MARRSKIKKLRTSVAVIGEGITERCYFENLKKDENLKYKLKPDLPSTSNFQKIFQKARQLLKNEYNYVYCIIDLDVIYNDNNIKNKYQNLKNKLPSNIIVLECMPCFEIWFLLHFKYTTRIFQNYNDLEPILLNHITDYSKNEQYFNSKELYSFLKNKLTTAIKYSKKLNTSYKPHIHSIFFTKCEIYKIIESLLSGKL
jgi:hypothetical protein